MCKPKSCDLGGFRPARLLTTRVSSGHLARPRKCPTEPKSLTPTWAIARWAALYSHISRIKIRLSPFLSWNITEGSSVLFLALRTLVVTTTNEPIVAPLSVRIDTPIRILISPRVRGGARRPGVGGIGHSPSFLSRHQLQPRCKYWLLRRRLL